MKNIEYTGAEIVIECLKEQGVDTVFGYPGGTILNIYDALYKHPEIKHILTSHEQGASHAADGYARSTGKVGVCLATSGPGSTNLVTGIATAFMDSVPMVAITCNVNLPALGKDSFQEVDIVGITMPVTKHGFIVKDVSELADTIRKAFHIARSGRPGPVIIDITKDVTANKCSFENKTVTPVTYKKNYTDEDIDKAVELMQKSKKPLIYAGGGVIAADAYMELRKLAEIIDAPVCDTLMGKGAFDGRDARYTGMIGMHGTKASNLGATECDLLIALGARFSDRVIGNASKFCKNAKIIHFDIDAAEINKNIKADVAVVGNLKSALADCLSKLTQQNNSAWLARIAEFKEKYPLKYPTDRLTCPYVIEAIDRVTQGQAIISTDVGQHQMWSAQYYRYNQPRTFLSSGGLGTMGYGLGAVIGAKMGNPDKICINVAGDGCFRMNMNELATASRYNIPIIEVVINNHVLGMVRQWQSLFYEKRYSQTVLEDAVDYCKVAEGLGCKAILVRTKEEVEPAIREAIEAKAPVLINVCIEKDDSVFPMVPAGAPISEVFDEDDLKNREK